MEAEQLLDRQAVHVFGDLLKPDTRVKRHTSPLTSIATAVARTTANAEPTTRTVWARIHSSVWVAPVDEEPPADSMAASAGRFDPTA